MYIQLQWQAANHNKTLCINTKSRLSPDDKCDAGLDDCCTQCDCYNEGDGDCDGPLDCKGEGMTCGRDNCRGLGVSGAERGDDCCYKY